MAIFARVENKFSVDTSYLVMVDPIEARLGDKATFASGIEITVTAHDSSGVEIPESQIKILGYGDKRGGRINGVEMRPDRLQNWRLGVLSVTFYPEDPQDFGDDMQELDDYNRQKLEEKGSYFLDNIKKCLRDRRKATVEGALELEGVAGRMLLDGMDDYGLLELRVKRTDSKGG